MVEMLDNKSIGNEIFDRKQKARIDDELKAVLRNSTQRKNSDNPKKELDDAVAVVAMWHGKNIRQVHCDEQQQRQGRKRIRLQYLNQAQNSNHRDENRQPPWFDAKAAAD